MSEPIELLIRVCFVLLAAWLIVVALRKSSPSLRALVWTLALGSALLLPALSAMVPRLKIAMLMPVAQDRVQPPVSSPLIEPLAPVSEPATTPRAPEPGSSFERELPPVTRSGSQPASSISWPIVALAVWSTGFFLLLLRVLLSHRTLASLVRRAGGADDEWHILVNQVRRQLGVRRSVAVKMTDAVEVPAIVGVFRPTLLLSPDVDELDPLDRRDVVLHELAHVARWDGLAQLVCQVSCAAYWFIPLAWHGAGRAALLRERACDDVVLNAGSRASSYARNLLHLAGQARGAELEFGALAMARPSRIEERVMGILDTDARRHRVTGRAGLTVMALAGGIIAAVAAVEPVARELAAASAPMGAIDAGTTIIPSGAGVDLRPGAVAGVVTQRSARDTSLLCTRGVKSSSNSINEGDHGDRRWTVKVEGEDCKVDMRLDGKVEFNDDFTDIKSISNGGFFRLDVMQGDNRHELEIRSRNGTLERTWRVNGTVQPYDAAAQAWFATFLIDLDRRTAVGMEIRLPRLLRQGGVKAVLDETAQMGTDYPRSRYYSGLLKSTRLTADELKRMLDQAAAMMESDYYAAELLKEVGSDGLDDAGERAAVVAMLQKMESDYYRAEVMGSVIDAGRPSAEEMTALLQVVGLMKSDYYQAETLGRLLENGQLTAEQRAMVARAASSMESAYYTAEVLKKLVAKGNLTDAERVAFLEAVQKIQDDYQTSEILGVLLEAGAPSSREIGLILQAAGGVDSDYYKGEILGGLLQSGSLTEADLLSIVTQTRQIQSEYNKSETLQRVLTNRGANDRVRQAVVEAANAMNGYYRDEVKRAAGAI